MDYERTIEVHDKVVLRAAEGTAKFYRAAWNYVLDPVGTGVSSVEKVMNELPNEMRNLYEAGVARLVDGLKSNAEILQAHRGGEVDFLLRTYDPQLSENPQYERIKSGFHFFEPSPGVLFLIGEQFAFDELDQAAKSKYGRTNSSLGSFVSFGAEDRPCFIVMSDMARTGVDSLESQVLLQNPTVLHETFHLVNHLLRKKDYLKSPDSAYVSPGDFERFRNEAVAYMLGDDDVGLVSNEALVLTKQAESLQKAEGMKHVIGWTREILMDSGFDPDLLIYPILKSRSYSEISHNCVQIVRAAVGKRVSFENIGRYYARFRWTPLDNLDVDEWFFNLGMKVDLPEMVSYTREVLDTQPTKSVDRILSDHGLKEAEDTTYEMYPHRSGYDRLSDLLQDADVLDKFGKRFGLRMYWSMPVLCEVAAKRTGLSRSAIGVIDWSKEKLDYSSVDLDGDGFSTYRDVLTLKNLESPEFYDVVGELFKSDKKLRDECEERLGELDRVLWERYKPRFEGKFGVGELKERALVLIKIARFNAFVKSKFKYYAND